MEETHTPLSSLVRTAVLQPLGRVAAWLLLLPLWPFSKLLAVLRVVLAPVITTAECILWLTAAFWSALAGLEIFSAALVGIFAGLVLFIASHALAAVFGMHDPAVPLYRQPENSQKGPYDGAGGGGGGVDDDGDLDDPSYYYYHSSSHASISSSGDGGSSSPWPILGRKPAAPAVKRRRGDREPGLLAQTIHEEESSDF